MLLLDNNIYILTNILLIMKYQDIYKSEDWKSLKNIDRAQLLLVIEGLKKGTIIGGNWFSFRRVIKRTGLDYDIIARRFSLRPVFAVAHNEDLEEYDRRSRDLADDFTKEHMVLQGWFLGYPQCCVQEYVRKRTPEEKQALKEGKRHLSYKFGRELTSMLQEQGNYPDVFNYSSLTFTPCGINCPNALQLLSAWREVLQKYDPQAGAELADFNKRSIQKIINYLKNER